jgi:predicted transcriptional regulator
METLSQFKKRSRNEIDRLKQTFGVTNAKLSEHSGVSTVTIGKISSHCQDVSAETIEKVLMSARQIVSERVTEYQKIQEEA